MENRARKISRSCGKLTKLITLALFHDAINQIHGAFLLLLQQNDFESPSVLGSGTDKISMRIHFFCDEVHTILKLFFIEKFVRGRGDNPDPISLRANESHLEL